jgi:hypothetical protein
MNLSPYCSRSCLRSRSRRNTIGVEGLADAAASTADCRLLASAVTCPSFLDQYSAISTPPATNAAVDIVLYQRVRLTAANVAVDIYLYLRLRLTEALYRSHYWLIG